ncbi:diguanylate cyclase [Marinobacterium lacunae]|uniref:histidine kinase n=1 Tax=Marinobacterium lacunae TaxID=1232683 RepID=A0A081FZ10_9GAMM|nr:diguanylate cyclase [Marinobacterium lacunae]
MGIVGVLVINRFIEYEVRNQITAKLDQTSVAYQSVLRGLRQVATTLFEEKINTPEVLSRVAAVNDAVGDERNRAREQLYTDLYPIYQRSKARGFPLVQFHGPQGLSLLRFNEPLKYDDSLFEIRESVRLVNTNMKAVEGFEIGRLVHGFRFVFPLVRQGEHLGSFESSVPFRTVEQRLNDLVQGERFELVLNSDRAFAMLLQSERSRYQPFRLSDEFVTDVFDAMPSSSVAAATFHARLETLLDRDRGAIDAGMTAGRAFGITKKLEGKRFAVLFLPVISVAREVDAYIVAYSRVPEIETIYRDGRWIQLSFGALMLSLTAGFYRRQRSRQAIERERKKLQAITQRMGEGLFVQNSEGRITFLNEAAERVLGVTAQQALGQRAHELFHVHVDGQGLPVLGELCPIVGATDQGRIFESEDEHFQRVSDQTLVPVQITSAPFSVEGEAAGSVTIFRDITRRKQEEAQRTLASVVFNNTIVGVVVTDAQERVLSLNQAFTSITGYTLNECVGRHIRFMKSGVHDEAFYTRMWTSITTDGYWQGEVWNRLKDGQVHVFLQSISAVRNEDGEVSHYVGVFSDITERKQHEEALKKARCEALASAQAKSEFLANMSHEIRTPMNGVLGMIDLVLGSELSAEQRDFLSVARKSSRSLLTLLNSILDLAKYESGKFSPECINFALREMLDETLKLFTAQAQNKAVELSLAVDDAVPEHACGDPARIRQVLINLLDNAFKFTDAGQVMLTARVSGQDDRGFQLSLSVCDTGVGIAPDMQERIFDLFTQADGSITRRYGGTGLGLALCREIVTSLGGSLTVESEPNVGSTFSFTVHLESVLDDADAPGAPGAGAATNTLAGLRVLLAEDNEVNRQVAIANLERLGCEVVAVVNGEEALERICREHFDIALMDCQMPRMDGRTATRKLRTLERETGQDYLPVIAMTAFVNADDIQRCFDAGMDAYLGKPFELDLLRALLAEYTRCESVDEAMVSSNAVETGGPPTLCRHTLDKLSELLDGEIGEIIDAFIVQVPELLAKIDEGITADDRKSVSRAAHSLKGSTSNLGGSHLAALALELEKQAAQMNPDQLKAQRLAMGQAADELIKVLSDYLSPESPGATGRSD